MFNTTEPNISYYFRHKRYVDFPIAVLLSVVALPIVAVAMLLVRLTSREPALFSQVRLGLDGKPFTIYKIRTMRSDAEIATGAVWTAKNDQRITPIGRILRKMHLDELPQLYNVLRGDMDLVGPRPERPEFVTELEKRIDGYAYRLYVKPGWAGLAQLNQEADVDLNDVRRKLVFDFDYIENSSFWLDMRLLFCAALKVVFLCRLPVLKFFRVHREAQRSNWATTLLPGGATSTRDEDRLSRILLKRATA